MVHFINYRPPTTRGTTLAQRRARHRWSYRLSPASVSSAARQRSSAGSQPTLGQPLFRHRWHPHPRHNVGATTYIPPVVCHQPTTTVSTGTSPPSVLPPSRHRWLTVGLPMPPLPPPCRRLPPSRHHCLVNWDIFTKFSLAPPALA